MLQCIFVKLFAFILGVVLLGGSAWAHDPHELTSVVYLQSNRIELFIETEFPAGMTLAGLTPRRDVAAETQFEAGLPRLKNFIGGLLEITAGNNVVRPLQTNVELGVELHIRGRVEFALTDDRPLRFAPRGLQAGSDVPYGIALTVLDMVNKKVLGQSALFADSPAAEFPATSPTVAPLAQPTVAVTKVREAAIASPTTNSLAADRGAEASRRSRWPVVIFLLGGLVVVVGAWCRSNSRA